MHESIDWPRKAQSARHGNHKLFALVAVVVSILFGSRTALSYWVGLLWFESLGYGDVFARQLALQWGSFAAFAVITFCVLHGVLSLLNRVHRTDMPLDRTIFFGGRELNLSVKPVVTFVAMSGSIVIALVTGGAMASEWPTLALFWFGSGAASNTADPIFGKSLSFFLFTLPAWNLLAGWLLAMAVMACLFAGLFILMSGAASLPLDTNSLEFLRVKLHGRTSSSVSRLARLSANGSVLRVRVRPAYARLGLPDS